MEPLERIAPESREFLVSLFTDLREDLANQTGDEAVAGKRTIYDGLLSGLADEERFPDDETVREYVVGLAKGVDEANQFEQATLEHRALAELVRALGGEGPTEPGAAAVDWDGLLAHLLHPTQLQIIEAMHWIYRPVSAGQLVQIFDRDRKDLSAMSYHLRRLKTLKIVRFSSVSRIRGARERLYTLTTNARGLQP
jgi:DNA-binding transcriptional ArsR family regulator